MKTVLKNNAKAAKYLSKLPKIYLVACWARYGVWDLIWSGKFIKDKDTGHLEPLVWHYNDHNGTADNWYLRPLHNVTTGFIMTWTQDRCIAESIANALNIRMELRRKN